MLLTFTTILSALADAISVLQLSGSFYRATLAFRQRLRKEYVSFRPVLTKADHNEMWRWNQRLFRSRHPHRYDSFDMVDMKLGEKWWSIYPRQDWRIVDAFDNHVGTYCLIPIREQAFDRYLSGRMSESDLTQADILHQHRIYSHQYWYLANYAITRRRAGVGEAASDYVRSAIGEHVLERMLTEPDFSTQSGHEIQMVAFIEAPSIESVAKSWGFQKSLPEVSDSQVFVIRISRDRAKAMLRRLRRRKSRARKSIKKHRKEPMFEQPPHFGTRYARRQNS